MAKSTNSKPDKSESDWHGKVFKMKYNGKEIDVELSCKLDREGFTNEDIIEMYKTISLGRKIDEKAALYLKMAKGWSYHASFAGHDGIQYALGSNFRQGKDYLFPYYRDMLTALAAGITPEEIILNGLSKDTDVAGGGRHMSNHFSKSSIGIQNVSSCTGNHSLHAAGTARASKKFKTDEVSYYSSGESACSEGYFWESVNVATLEKLPVVFVIQNNRYGISVPLSDQTANQVISDNYSGMKGLKIINCDGRDPFDSLRAMRDAKDYALSGQGPAMVHADCDRVASHSNSDRHELYRSEEEIKTVRRRDPLLQLRYYIIMSGIASEEEIIKIEENHKQLLFKAADKAEAAPNANGNDWDKFIIPEPLISKTGFNEPEKHAGDDVAMIESINRTLKQEFRLNKKAFLWGQDVGKGGIFNVVKGMPEEFTRERVFNAPIAEDSIIGTANGFSRYSKDIRIVVEGAEFADYFWPAMEQLIECSHEYWRTRGQYAPNIVIRLASGGYIQGGLYHSQNLESIFTTIPGIRVVTPAFADDASAMLRHAIRSEGVTLFLEPKFLYNYKGAHAQMPADDYMLPFGKAKVRNEGSDLTIVSYATAVHWSLQVAKDLEKEGYSVEVIDLRSLSPWDKETVLASVKKTNKLLIAHEDRVNGGVGGEIAATVTEEAFTYLDAPIMRVGSKPSPVGFAKEYEQAILLNPTDIYQAAKKLLAY